MPRILIVEDDDPIRTLLAAALRRESLDVDTAQDGGAALALTRECDYAVIILDLMMPRVNGFEFLDAFRATKQRSVIFVITAFEDTHLAALDPVQVHAIIHKPFDVPQLVTMVREVAALWVEAPHAPRTVEPEADRRDEQRAN
jgi:DNA-binding response OmpR family regulator